MAITRRTAISKPQQQQPTPLPPLPPAAVAVAETNSNSNNNTEQLQQQHQPISDYELTREQRIKENRERLQKLGIVDLSLQLSSIVASKRTPKTNYKYERRTPLKSPSSGASSDTPRRSSRLQNAPPVTYTELKEEKSRRPRDIVLEEGAKPEVYTEEHEKLLGNTEMPWTFGIDGYGPNGTRIYDPVNGKTCHQCRQKTLGQRTHCCKCNIVQGQFCGDCLMARYGEHVVEANQNPNWICPPCRGICNCSLCRQARGWYPTGAIYRTISSLGYKSVAHYLIATKRAPPVSEMSSTKRSLPFQGMEVFNDNSSNSKAMVESAEINQQSKNNAVIVNESDPKSATAGRTRKRSKKEHSDASEDLVKVTDKSDLKKASVGRPGKKPKKEINDAEGVPSAAVNGPNTSTFTASESNSTQVVRRSTRRSKKENDDVIQESVETSAATGDEAVSTMKGLNISDSKEDNVARKLRSRDRS